MPNYMLPLTRLSLVFLLALQSASQADIEFSSSPGFVQPNENVLFNENGLVDMGTTIEGITHISREIVVFESSSTLETPSGGQARVEGANGGFGDLNIFLDSGKTFTSAEFNVNMLHRMEGTLSVVVDFLSGNSELESSESFLVGNGSNWVGILATGGDVIKSIALAISDPAAPNNLIIQDVRQVRLEGIASGGGGGGGNDPPPIAVVPEPASIAAWLLAAACLAFFAGRHARR